MIIIIIIIFGANIDKRHREWGKSEWNDKT